MNKTWKIVLWVLAIILLVGIVVGITNKNKKIGSQEKIKIGVLGPMTGSNAIYGQYMKEALNLAMKDLDPKLKDRVVLVEEDDKCTGTDGVSGLNKLVELDGVKYIIGPLCNSVTIATEKIFDENNVISLTSGVPSDQIANMGENHFTFTPKIEYLMDALARHIYKTEHNKVSIVYTNDAFGKENFTKFKEEFESLGGEIKLSATIDQGVADFRNEVLKIKNTDSNAVVILVSGKDAINLIRELDRQGVKLDKFAAHTIQIPDILDQVSKEADGLIYPYPVNSKVTERSTKFVKDFEETYGQAPNLYAVNVYDSFFVLLDAINKCGYENFDCVKSTLATTKNYEGAGGLISLDQNGVAQFDDLQLRIIKDGKFQNLNN